MILTGVCPKPNMNNTTDTQAWYRADGRYGRVPFVEATSNSENRVMTESIVGKQAMKIKAVERFGKKMKSLLQKSYQFSKNICKSDDCLICTEGFKGNFSEREVGCIN